MYGDPLYALNYQPLAYLAWEHAQPTTPPGALGYISQKVLSAPFRTFDTAALGMTSYPFLNKWQGFEPWFPGLGTGLAAAALVGLALFLTSRNGRLLLLVLGSAQVPFAFTWMLSSDWRYTEFAYPFYLIAASVAIDQVVGLLWRAMRPAWSIPRYSLARLTLWASVMVAIGVAVWGIQRTLPALTLRESLDDDGSAIVQAGGRDRAFFVDGWSRPMTNGNVTSRVSVGDLQVLSVPLSRAVDYSMLLRLDPFPRPATEPVGSSPRVRVFMNGTLVADVELHWNPERVGAYPINVPARLVAPGGNRLVLMLARGTASTIGGPPTEAGLSEWSAFSFWNVVIRPLS
jgi:hypothetical protein